MGQAEMQRLIDVVVQIPYLSGIMALTPGMKQQESGGLWMGNIYNA